MFFRDNHFNCTAVTAFLDAYSFSPKIFEVFLLRNDDAMYFVANRCDDSKKLVRSVSIVSISLSKILLSIVLKHGCRQLELSNHKFQVTPLLNSS